MRDRRLMVRLERGELVIRIGIDTLSFCADECPLFYNGKKDRCDVKVVDQIEWAKDVLHELEREEEDGSTPVTEMLDRAMNDAVDQGSIAVRLAGDDEK